MENEPEVIRQQMDETRTALADKLEKLEQQVVGTVHDASEAVNETVGSVKEAVHETVQTVKESVHETMHSVKEVFDIRHQAAVRPWMMMTGAVGLGFLGGLLAHRISGDGRHPESRELSNRWPRGRPGFWPASLEPAIRPRTGCRIASGATGSCPAAGDSGPSERDVRKGTNATEGAGNRHGARFGPRRGDGRSARNAEPQSGGSSEQPHAKIGRPTGSRPAASKEGRGRSRVRVVAKQRRLFRPVRGSAARLVS